MPADVLVSYRPPNPDPQAGETVPGSLHRSAQQVDLDMQSLPTLLQSKLGGFSVTVTPTTSPLGLRYVSVRAKDLSREQVIIAIESALSELDLRGEIEKDPPA